ncbi:MAG: cytochrome ubiquinol oxidase subunit I [Bacteroidales bacterium]|jgi:cytochrome d ubiquinol oxidase subunit I|nr:cytochrome ubiquinol oxidase subunit I [Bacteroidales bacterium]
MEQVVDFSLIDWSRLQFALTAMYHWIFVPLTLGITFIIAIMETKYVSTGREEWKQMTKFWMTLFGINFAVGVATGLILEFQFGTNWSNYSWFVGDIFGAPLAVEGIMAFFMEATFVAVMFFGWNRVSKRFHLISTWLVALAVNLSALWILVANAWMQNPVGMRFNPETARNEMVDFWAILLSPTAINKFIHTVTSGFMTAGIFVVGISCWFLLKKRHQDMARKSIIIGAAFGLAGSLVLFVTGDSSARQVAKEQPMKLAVIEGLYNGQEGAPFSIIAWGTPAGNPDRLYEKEVFALKVPKMLSLMAFHDFNAFVPGITDLIEGNNTQGIMSAYEKAERGKEAQNVLRRMKDAKNVDTQTYLETKALFENEEWIDSYFRYFGYGYYYDSDIDVFKQNIARLVPNVPLNFWAFRVMIGLGCICFIVLAMALWWACKNSLYEKKWFYRLAVICIPLVYIATQCGWIVAEVGRQPWVIQDLMPTVSAVSQIGVGSVKTTFILFAITFTVLLIAEIKIMISQIKKGPREG